MTVPTKRIEELTPEDLVQFPVWQFVSTTKVPGGLGLRPVNQLPVNRLDGRLAGCQVVLNSNRKFWALLGNVDLKAPQLNQHFLTISVLNRTTWFTMARYFDFDANERGAFALASFLGLDPKEVFPISYDLSSFCVGDKSAVAGVINMEPDVRLSRAEIIALAVP